MPDVQPRHLPRFYRAFQLAAGVALLTLAIVFGLACARSGRWTPPPENVVVTAKNYPHSGNDFTAFYSAGEQARLGKNIYEFKTTTTPRRPYGYPPLFAVFPMMLLSLLSHNTALAVFYALNAIMLTASYFMLRRLLWPPLSSYDSGTPLWLTPLAGLLLTFALSWRFIQSNTFVGNANLYILFFMTLAFYFDARRRDTNAPGALGGILSGLFIAVATAIKLTPGLFGIYFLWSFRRWSMLGGAAGLLLFFFLVPAAWLGWDANMKYVQAYAQFAVGKAIWIGPLAEDDPNRIVVGRPHPLDPNDSDLAQGSGVSFRGILTNLLTPAPALKKSGDRPRTVNIATLEPKQVGRIANVLSLLLLAGTIALTFGSRANRGAFAPALSWSLVTVTMTLISPLTRIAHLVVLVIPIATLIVLLQQKRLSGAAKILAFAALAMQLVGTLPNEYLHAIGLATTSLLFLFAALAAAKIQLEKS